MTDTADKFRTGRTVGRTIYRNGLLVGMMDTPQLAEQVVSALQKAATESINDGQIGSGALLDAAGHESILEMLERQIRERDQRIARQAVTIEARQADWQKMKDELGAALDEVRRQLVLNADLQGEISALKKSCDKWRLQAEEWRAKVITAEHRLSRAVEALREIEKSVYGSPALITRNLVTQAIAELEGQK